MSEQIDIDLNINMNNLDDVDELTSKLQSVNEEIENITEELAQIYMGDIEGDAEALEERLAAASEEAEKLQSDLDNLHVDNSDIDETNEKLQESESTAASLGTALGGLAGMMGIDQMIEKADRIKTSYNQLSLTFKGTGVSMDTLKEKSSQLSQATGRSGTQVRDYFNQMGIAGITNVDLLSTSFENMAGRAYQTGTSVEQMEGSVQKMVMTGNAGAKLLSGLGISTTELGNAMGVSAGEASKAFKELDQTERLEVLNKAMGDGKEANEMYKNSYAGLKEQASIAIGGLMSAVGEGILPVVNPLIRSSTSLVRGFSNSFKSLPGPVKGAVGGIAGFLAVGTATIGTLGLLGKVGKGVVDGIKSIKDGYDTAKKAMEGARVAIDMVRNGESISSAIKTAYAIATSAEATAEGGATAAKSAAIGPTTGLAIAQNSLLWPLLLIVGAIVAVIAVMWYLYNTNETVRNGVNWLINAIQSFISALQPIVQAIITFVTQGIQNLDKLPGAMWNIFVRVLTFVANWEMRLIQYGIQAATNFVNNVRNGLSNIGSAISSALSGVYNAITAPFQKAWDTVYNNVVKPMQNAWDTLTGFMGFEGYSGYGSYGSYGDFDTLNGAISTISNNSSNSNSTINNNFYGLVEESAADYIVNAVNDRLRREKLLKGE